MLKCLITRINEAKTLVKHVSCDCKFRSNSTTCNSNLKWNIFKYLTLISTDEGKGTLEKYEELWNKIRDLITSITNNSDNVHEKYMKIKFNSDDDLPLKEQ